MWYFELWYEDSFVYKSEKYKTKDDAILQAEKKIEEEMNKNSSLRQDKFAYELYCTGEDD